MIAPYLTVIVTVTITVILFSATPAWAYIDPGIVTALYQGLYALVFGVIAAWVLRPFEMIKATFASWFGKKPPPIAPLPQVEHESAPPLTAAPESEKK